MDKIHGKSMSLIDISNRYHIDLSVLEDRQALGYHDEELINPTLHYKDQIEKPDPKPRKAKELTKYNILGKMMTVPDICEEYHLTESTVRHRIYMGFPAEKIIQPRKRTKKELFDINGEKLCIKEISDKYHVPESTIRYRYQQGYSIVDAIRYSKTKGNKFTVDHHRFSFDNIVNKYEVDRYSLAKNIVDRKKNHDLLVPVYRNEKNLVIGRHSYHANDIHTNSFRTSFFVLENVHEFDNVFIGKKTDSGATTEPEFIREYLLNIGVLYGNTKRLIIDIKNQKIIDIIRKTIQEIKHKDIKIIINGDIV